MSQQTHQLLQRNPNVCLSSVNIKTSHPVVLEVSQNPRLGFLFSQISCFCSHNFSSGDAQPIAPVLPCLPPFSPMAQCLSVASSPEAVKPSALFNTIKTDFFFASSSSHHCFSFLLLLEPLPTNGQNLGSIFNSLFRKRANNLYLPVSLLPCPSLNI